MEQPVAKLISVVVPLYNEAGGLRAFHDSLGAVLETCHGCTFEIIYCDDGSLDDTAAIIGDLRAKDRRVKLVKLSRNFGKESALTAGIAQANGQAVLMLDGDGQHPVEIIPKFIDAWQQGAQVVIGIRAHNNLSGWAKRISSKFFYKLFNLLTDQKLLANATDFRLIDRVVQHELLTLTETDRITRGLIDWLGFRRVYLNFTAKPRLHGSTNYKTRKLLELATNSFVSLTPKPLYLFGYLGIFITVVALVVGMAVAIEQLLLGDPLGWKFTGTAMLAILLLFLVGMLMVSQGILSLYISHIHSQSKGRPLYVIDRQGSAGIDDEPDS